MAARLRDAVNRREARRDEVRDFLQRLALDDDEKIEAAAHEVDCAHFVKAVDALGDGVETDLSLRHEVDLDDGRDRVVAKFLPVDQRVVGQDDFVFFEAPDVLLDLVFALAEHRRNLADRTARIVFQKFQKFSHDRVPPS